MDLVVSNCKFTAQYRSWKTRNVLYLNTWKVSAIFIQFLPTRLYRETDKLHCGVIT